MAIERIRWRPCTTLDEANAQLRRALEVLDTNTRTAVLAVGITATLQPTYPTTMVEADTTVGAVVLTFPAASTVPGFRFDVVKVTGANTLTANSVVVTTFAGWVSSGTNWRRVA